MNQPYYTLDDQLQLMPVDVLTWSDHFSKRLQAGTHRVADDALGDDWVSTVFTGLNKRVIRDGPPLVFETMVKIGDRKMIVECHASWGEAKMGHARICALLKWMRQGNRQLSLEALLHYLEEE